MGTPIAISLSQRFSAWSLGLARECGSPAPEWQTWCRRHWPRRRFGNPGIRKASPSNSFSISLLRDPNTVELGDYFGDENSSISMVQIFFFFCLSVKKFFFFFFNTLISVNSIRELGRKEAVEKAEEESFEGLGPQSPLAICILPNAWGQCNGAVRGLTFMGLWKYQFFREKLNQLVLSLSGIYRGAGSCSSFLLCVCTQGDGLNYHAADGCPLIFRWYAEVWQPWRPELLAASCCFCNGEAGMWGLGETHRAGPHGEGMWSPLCWSQDVWAATLEEEKNVPPIV